MKFLKIWDRVLNTSADGMWQGFKTIDIDIESVSQY